MGDEFQRPVRYGGPIFELIRTALAREHRQLHRLKSAARSEINSIHQFEEGWIQYVIFKAAIRRPFPGVTVCCEISKHSTRADLALVSRDNKPLVSVEFKSGKPNTDLRHGVLKDLSPQRNRDYRERYVAVLVYGAGETNKRWAERIKHETASSLRSSTIGRGPDAGKSVQLYFFGFTHTGT